MSDKSDELVIVLEEAPVAVVEEAPIVFVKEEPAAIEETPAAIEKTRPVGELISYFEKCLDDSIKIEKENIDIKQMEENEKTPEQIIMSVLEELKNQKIKLENDNHYEGFIQEVINIYTNKNISLKNIDEIYKKFNITPLKNNKIDLVYIYIDYNDITAILVKYYPDGSFQSCARVISVFGNCYGNSIRVINGKIYVSGFIDSSTDLYAYSSDYSVAQGTPFYRSGIFVTKYLSDDFYSPFEFPSPGYPEVLQTRLKIGGSVRKLVGGYVYDGPVEIWGGQTGFTPGAITLEDANTGVVAHLGHEPGYSNRLNVNDYLYDYPYLTVNLSEPSFPLNDPQPVTPGTIPYGFLPIYISAPESTTSLKFNTDYVNDINSNVDAMLYAIGSASEDGTFFSGISAGDVIRLMIINDVSNVSNQYITLKVKGFVVSKTPIIPAAIVFEEPVSYLQAVIGGIQTSSSMLITTTHIFDRVDIPGVVPSSSSYDFVNQILLCPDATFESTVSVGDYISICTYDNFLEKIICFTSIVEEILSDTLLQLKFIYGSGMYNYDIISIQKLIIAPKKYLSAFIQPVLVQSGTLRITLETIPENN
jgi:hypothetical protein